MDFVIIVVDVVLDAVAALVPAIATEPRGFEVVNVRPQSWIRQDLVYDFGPFAFQVSMGTQEPSHGAMDAYFIACH